MQGCFEPLQALLNRIDYHPQTDRLGFVGDLVNRGPASLDTLRFIQQLPNPIVVLGNHDLFLLALGYGVIEVEEEHTLHDILNAPDKIELLDWLRQQPLLYFEKTHNTCITHAGVPPQWNLEQALTHAEEVSAVLKSDRYLDFLKAMCGNTDQWSEALTGWERLRYITNAFTRMRFCDAHGTLDLLNKTHHTDRTDMHPWFDYRHDDFQIVYGHWAALEGKQSSPTCFGIDTGCVYGGALTALRLGDGQRFQSTPRLP